MQCWVHVPVDIFDNGSRVVRRAVAEGYPGRKVSVHVV